MSNRGVKILNQLAGAMDQDPKVAAMKDKMHSNPARPMGAQREAGLPDASDHLDQDHHNSEGEDFDIEGLHQKVKDLHEHVQKLMAHKGGVRGEQSE